MIDERPYVASWFCTKCQREMPTGQFGRHLVAEVLPFAYNTQVHPEFVTPKVFECPGPVWARNQDGRLFCPIHCIEITRKSDAAPRYLVCSYEQVMADVLATIPARTIITPEGEFHA